ncbi:MAG: hypothetical protein ABFR89_09385 [Actinomycetota bacterium]
MRRPTRRVQISVFVAALAVLAAGCAAFPQPKTETSDDLAGTYYLNGTDAQGTEYGGRLEITVAEQPDEYDMQWIITGSIQIGTGTRSGSHLDVEWETVTGTTDKEHGEASSGTAEYTIDTDGTLRGTRTIDGVEGTGTEEAFPVAE